MPNENAIVLEQVSWQIDGRPVLQDLSLTCPAQKMTAILGASGSGKSTLLRLVAGLTLPDRGRILLKDNDVTTLSPQKRPLSLVFQNFSLFPHLTVAENVAYGLPKYDQNTVELSLVNLDILHLQDRYPSTLSGGQQQRVALARALATKPEILLLDEPLAHVDPPLRGQIRDDIRSLQRRFGITGLYVTHDLTEALSIADQIAVIQNGQICQFGSPEEIYNRPRSPFVAHFLGATNFLHTKITSRVEITPSSKSPTPANNFAYYATVLGRQSRIFSDQRLNVGDEVLVTARPHTITLQKTLERSVFGPIGQVIDRRFLGEKMQYWVETQGATLTVTVPLQATFPSAYGAVYGEQNTFGETEAEEDFQIGDLVEVHFHSLWVVS